jgi:hypothetical protein
LLQSYKPFQRENPAYHVPAAVARGLAVNESREGGVRAAETNAGVARARSEWPWREERVNERMRDARSAPNESAWQSADRGHVPSEKKKVAHVLEELDDWFFAYERSYTERIPRADAVRKRGNYELYRSMFFPEEILSNPNLSLADKRESAPLLPDSRRLSTETKNSIKINNPIPYSAQFESPKDNVFVQLPNVLPPLAQTSLPRAPQQFAPQSRSAQAGGGLPFSTFNDPDNMNVSIEDGNQLLARNANFEFMRSQTKFMGMSKKEEAPKWIANMEAFATAMGKRPDDFLGGGMKWYLFNDSWEWFASLQKYLPSWDVFKKQFLHRYSMVGSVGERFRKSCERPQKECEKMTDYIAACSRPFLDCANPVSDELMVQAIYTNMRPDYLAVMPFPDSVSSLADLLEHAIHADKVIEARRHAVREENRRQQHPQVGVTASKSSSIQNSYFPSTFSPDIDNNSDNDCADDDTWDNESLRSEVSEEDPVSESELVVMSNMLQVESDSSDKVDKLKSNVVPQDPRSPTKDNSFNNPTCGLVKVLRHSESVGPTPQRFPKSPIGETAHKQFGGINQRNYTSVQRVKKPAQRCMANPRSRLGGRQPKCHLQKIPPVPSVAPLSPMRNQLQMSVPRRWKDSYRDFRLHSKAVSQRSVSQNFPDWSPD